MAASESLQSVWSVTVSKVMLPRILHGGVAQKMLDRHTGGGVIFLKYLDGTTTRAVGRERNTKRDYLVGPTRTRQQHSRETLLVTKR